MAMRQLGRNIRVLSRTATVGSAARQFHPMTGPSSYGFGASFPSGGAAFSNRCFFCTGLPSPPQRRRTQGFINFMRAYTYTFIRDGSMLAGGMIMVVVLCDAFGFDFRRKLHKMLLVKNPEKASQDGACQKALGLLLAAVSFVLGSSH